MNKSGPNKVGDIIKDRITLAVNAHTLVPYALRYMYGSNPAEQNMSAVGILDGFLKFAGIFYESDLTHHIRRGGNLEDNLVTILRMRNYKRAEDKIVSPETSLLECFELMTAGNRTHLAVLDGDTFLGLISHKDIGPSIGSQLREDEREIHEAVPLIVEIERQADSMKEHLNSLKSSGFKLYGLIGNITHLTAQLKQLLQNKS